MPEMLSFTDGQFPNSNTLEGYETLEIVELDASIWSKMLPPKNLQILCDGRLVGELSLGRDRSGLFSFEKSSYGVSSRTTSKDGDREETYYLEAYDQEFEKTFCRSMAHGIVSVVSISGFDIRQSLIGKEQSQRVLASRSASVAKVPAWSDKDASQGVIGRVFVRKGVEEPDLLILNTLLLSDRATWHAIIART